MTTVQPTSIIFQSLDWYEKNEDMYDEDGDIQKHVIRIFGRSINGESVHVKVLNYTPHFYIEIPEIVIPRMDMYIVQLIEFLKMRNKKYKDNFIKFDKVERKKFRYFTNEKKIWFIRLIFNNSEAMMAYAKTVLYNEMTIMNIKIQLTVYESNINTFLRFMHIKDIYASGWLCINKYQPCDEETTTTINIQCNWLDILKHSDQNLITKISICSFDIECVSHSDITFPQATIVEDKIIQIGMVFSYNTGEIYKKYIITLDTCDEIDDVIVIAVETERELLLMFTKIIQDEDPDILTGFNIWGFDEKYMYDRTKLPHINCEYEFLQMSKMRDIKCMMIEKELSSAGLGDNKLKYIEIYGRIQIDLMKIVQKDYKLSRYNLDTVAETFIQEKIISYVILDEHHLEIISSNLHYIKLGNYIKIINQAELEYGTKEEQDEGEDEYEDYCDEKYKITMIDYNTQKMIIENMNIKFEKEGLLDLGKELKWGLVKDDVHYTDIFRLQKGTSSDRKIIAEYCIQDCVLVSKLLYKLDVLNNLIGMSNVCHVPIYFLLVRGQGIKILSLVAKTCRLHNFLVPVLKINRDYDSADVENVKYEGATVFEPKIGFYQTYIPVLDYNSLYPNSIISANISHETLVQDKQYENLEDYIYNEVEYMNSDNTTTKCIYAKHKDNTKIGILPLILKNLLQERATTRKQMAIEKDVFKKKILDGRQLALKVSANSLYGVLGAHTSPLCMKELAASTTATGRKMLEFARSFVENELVSILQKYYTVFKNNDMDGLDELNKIYLLNTSTENNEFIKTAICNLLEQYKLKPNIIYGDSCTGDTPILINNNNSTVLLEIQQFNTLTSNKWETYDNFKPYETQLLGKEMINVINDNLKIWTHRGWALIKKVIRHKTIKKIYRILTNSGCVDVTEDHSLLTCDGIEIKPTDCLIGQSLLHSLPRLQIELKSVDTNIYKCKSKLNAQLYYLNHNTQEHNIIIDYNEIDDEYILIKKEENENTKIKKIILIKETNEYVYDIETEYGVFHAGIGSMIIKNTDSVFCDMHIVDKNTNKILTTKEGVIHGINLGKLSSMFIKKKLPLPHNLEYEKTFYPFCIMSKKRYVGNKYENKPNVYKQAYTGIVLKRRDNANIVKKIIGGLINIMMDENDIGKALKYAEVSIQNLLAGQYPITDFITTKTLKSKYKGKKLTTTSHGIAGQIGQWYWDDVECSQAHVKLCQRMQKREPGNCPQVNDRIPFVTVVKKQLKTVKLLQGDIIEHPDYIKNKNIPIDYLFYLTNQIMKPAIQFLEHLTPNSKALFTNLIELEKQKQYVSIYNFVNIVDTIEPIEPIVPVEPIVPSRTIENTNNEFMNNSVKHKLINPINNNLSIYTINIKKKKTTSKTKEERNKLLYQQLTNALSEF